MLSESQLADYAAILAASHRLASTPRIDPLGSRLNALEQRLQQIFVHARAAVDAKQRIEPAAEWLIDNFFLIKEQLRVIRASLPKAYSRALPQLEDSSDPGVQRILVLARELVSHVDNRVDTRVTRKFIDAYQKVALLRLGELWAMPLMLRIALIERIGQMAESIGQRIDNYATAHLWAEQMIEVAGSHPEDIVLLVADMARSSPPQSAAFDSELFRLLQGKNPALNLPLAWIEQRLLRGRSSLAQLLEEESRVQASDQVSIGNCITSLRLISRLSWADTVEATSRVEAVLREDPAGIYPAMDFNTRDTYRHAVEDLARRSGLEESEVARRAVDAADAAQSPGTDARQRHVGYQLIGNAAAGFAQSIAAPPRLAQRWRAALRAHPGAVYRGAVAVMTFVFAAFILGNGMPILSWPLEIAAIIAVLLACSYSGIGVVNWTLSHLLHPAVLPRLDFSKGIPETSRTLVVVPCMLHDAASIDEQMQALEVRFQGNQDRNLHFALLTDFQDADQEVMPEDEALLAHACAGIKALNQRHADSAISHFHLFHRRRVWSAGQNTWMGSERKRGKLVDLNRMLLGGKSHDFMTLAGGVASLVGTRYVITLDADTELPPQTALRLVETMAHPLNRPRFDPRLHRVVEGYGVLQPRITEATTDPRSSYFARVFSGDGSLDPYTRAVSDVYQDLFQESSYIGKGIYDVRAFTRATGRRFPHDLILSHDLIEGSYARTGFVSDIELRESTPHSYGIEARRRHRWIRGDWQIVQWLLPRVPGPRRHQIRNTLSAHHRWKILDNLRRSLVPLAFMLVWLRGWLFSTQPGFWTWTMLALLLVQPVLASLHALVDKSPATSWSLHLQTWRRATGKNLAQSLILLTMLPFEAAINMAAIARSAFRMLISRRHLLEWMPASALARFAQGQLNYFLRLMWIAPVGTVLTVAVLQWQEPRALSSAYPLLGLWLLSPALAWVFSRPKARAVSAALSVEQRNFLGVVARRTWRYFDAFVDAEHHHLPPDNYQEWPQPQTAARTSPTNIGLALLANVTANDFGYISPARMLQRCADTLAAMHQLPRHRGHFLNWYDTRTLQPLAPRYVSSVDSGNLVASLLVLRNALAVVDELPTIPIQASAGLMDTLHTLQAEIVASHCEEATPAAATALIATLAERIAGLRGEIRSIRTWRKQVLSIEATAADLQEQLLPVAECVGSASWAAALRDQCSDWLQFVNDNAPWLELSMDGAHAAAIKTLLAQLDANPTLGHSRMIATQVLCLLQENHVPTAHRSHDPLHAAMRRLCQVAAAREVRSRALIADCDEFAEADFGFLFDPQQKLLSIGHNVEQEVNDSSYYDLLASEARLCSYVAIARRQLPQAHWFALGRLLSAAAGETTLVSWSGSMFEYLMPLLVMPGYPDTLLERSCRTAIRNQIAYGEKCRTPWGISESGYNYTDTHLTYQYRAFGVPGMGLKRGLADDLVIAPYASAMAVMLEPAAAIHNMQRLASMGALADYGFYEALDYTPARVAEGKPFAMVRSFMVHHQGMSLLGLSALLHEHPMQQRFMREPALRANRLLLREKVPMTTPIGLDELDTSQPDEALREAVPTARVINTFNTSVPQVHLLSNGRYHVAVSQAGGGYSRWNELALTHWTEDATRDALGQFCYVRDLDSGKFWSNTLQPTRVHADSYSAVFAQARAEFQRRDEGIETRTRIAVSPEDDIELRRIRISNHSSRRRRIEVTSYAEVILARPSDAAAHPVFNKLFIETRILHQQHALLARRRARADDEFTPCMLHMLTVRGAKWSEPSFETDRARFIGRGHSVAAPRVLLEAGELSGGEGATLDPVVAIRRVVELAPGQSATVDLITGITPTQDAALELINRYFDHRLGNRVFELAWTHSQVIRQQLDMGSTDAMLFDRLVSSILHADPALRSLHGPRQHLPHGQSGLWKYGISGDLPIIVLRIANTDSFSLLRQLVQAHTWWRMKGVSCDLVIWNENASGYRQDLHDMIMGLISSSIEAAALDKPGGIFLRSIEHVTGEDRALMLAVAHAVFVDERGSLREQMPPEKGIVASTKRLRRPALRTATNDPQMLPEPKDLQCFNGRGGFSTDGNEYVIWLPPGASTPAPWSNVIANAQFGTVISESGGAYTWHQNAHDLRLTPWHNDPLCDDSGEAFYLRDEISGRFWSPTPLPARGDGSYITRHGFGYSCFESLEQGIACEMTVFIPVEHTVKLVMLKIHNRSGRTRKLSATGYVSWVLGEQRSRSAMHVSTELGAVTGAIFASNFFNDNISQQVAFLAGSEDLQSCTGDRREFIGRNGSLASPSAMRREKLSGLTGAGLDPCAALQLPLELAPGETHTLVFALGIGEDHAAARKLASSMSTVEAAQVELDKVQAYWSDMLARVSVHTPDPKTDLLFNGWLPYQVISARLWARSGYYQSSGAFGFRDQLQDVMSLIHIQPERVREQLQLCAAHQFAAGDVQHWWHPPTTRGVRTHISDDYLWLPWVAANYVDAIGDTEIWQTRQPFLSGRELNADEESYYDFADPTAQTASLYQHCKRAIEHGLRFGTHGLPLIGSGDWNDGMNRVGRHGRGESIWLGFFLCDVLRRFAPHARSLGDEGFATRLDNERTGLAARIEEAGWDGAWYRRAYTDDGLALGSAQREECRIDSIPQSWSILSEAADPERARQAVDSAMQHLVRESDALVQLFDPPFDKTEIDPGYIKGYVPGVRENGGQYTHAAVWLVIALAQMGRAEDAWHVFDLINPIRHGDSADAVEVYKVEPYVVAADVYWLEQQRGRGGWTWYTGSAGWMYRLLGEYLLGIRREGGHLRIAPCIPAAWTGYRIDYRFGASSYAINVLREGPGAAVTRLLLDGETQTDARFELGDDGRTHEVEVRLGESALQPGSLHDA